MALMIPDRVPADAPGSERSVYHALSSLPDPWRVLHSIAWQSSDDRQSDGEADFVLVRPERGVVVLEVKGGTISVVHGRWRSVDANGKRHDLKDPYRQATTSKHTLVKYLRSVDTRLPFLPASHAVVFPDVASVPRLGPQADEVTLLKGDLTNIEVALEKIAEPGEAAPLTESQLDTITALLAPTTTVRRLFKDDIADANARLMTLTAEQVRTLDRLRRNRRAIIYGGAGTGKTVLAIERARRLAVEGFRVLLTCFNKPLADHLGAELGGHEEIDVYTFHGLCRWQIGASGLNFPTDPTPEWWETSSASALASAIRLTGKRYDAIVVDEAQDFAAEWFLALDELLDGNDAPFYVFVDTHQAIYRENWEAPFDAVEYELDTNCRNTEPIARTVAGIFGDGPVTLGAHGPEPEFVAAEAGSDVHQVLRGLIQRLAYQEGLADDQIVILCQHRSTRDELVGKAAGSRKLVERGEPGIAIETIHRFKGLEADVVILVMDSLATDHDRKLAYIGTSRPRAHLIVMAPAEVGKALGVG